MSYRQDIVRGYFLLARPVLLEAIGYSGDTQFQGEPTQRGRWIHGVEKKLAIFDWNRRLSRKQYEIGPWLLWNVNMKS